MAVTASNKKKTRLDFASAIEEAVAPIVPEQEEEQIEEVSVTPAEVAAQSAAEDLPVEEPATEAVVAEETIETPAEEVVEEVKKQAAPKKQPTKKVKKEAPLVEEEEEEEPQDDLDALLSSMQTGRGVQKSVYLEEDVFKYIQAKCQKTNAKFSNVLNLLLRSAMKAQQKK